MKAKQQKNYQIQNIQQLCYIDFKIMIDSSSRSPSQRRSRSNAKQSQDKHKLFVTNLDGGVNESELQEQLRELFQKYGKLANLTVRRNKSGDYSFGFVEYEPGFDAQKVVDNLNGHEVKGKAMKVQFQDNSKRRKDPEKGCYTCGKMGHFARECRSKNGYRGDRGRYRSRSSSRQNDRKRRRRSTSESSERDRSRHKKKKERKEKGKSRDKSRDRDEKKKKKHKKRRGSSSDSRS